MKLFLAAFLVAQACAFTIVSPSRHATMLHAAEYTPIEGEGRINLKASARKMLTVDVDGFSILMPISSFSSNLILTLFSVPS